MTSRVAFAAHDGCLAVRAEEGERRFVRPDGGKVVDAVAADDGVTAYVLLDAGTGTGRVMNLVRDDAGSVLWRAQLPAGGATDSFTQFSVMGTGELVAWTWSGMRVTIDPVSGRLRGSRFTK